MENPFELIESRLTNIENLLSKIMDQFPKPAKENYLTIDQAAEFLNLSKHTLYNLTMRKIIPHFKHRQKLYFMENQLRDWVETGHRPPTAEDVRVMADALKQVKEDYNKILTNH